MSHYSRFTDRLQVQLLEEGVTVEATKWAEGEHARLKAIMDTPIAEKAAYVRAQTQNRDHHCHWPGCAKQVKPALFCCAAHWKLFPKNIQQAIWVAYRPGQESDWKPTRQYLEIVTDAIVWAEKYNARLMEIKYPVKDADVLKAAIAAHLAHNEIKLVHIWQTAGRFSAMMEWPYDPVRKKPLEVQKHMTGVGVDEISAVRNAVDKMGFGGIQFQLFLLRYAVELTTRVLK